MLGKHFNSWIDKMDKYNKEDLSKDELISLFELTKLSEMELVNLCDFRGLYFNFLSQENFYKNGNYDFNDPEADKKLEIFHKEDKRLKEKTLFLEEIIDDFYYKNKIF